nr:CBS domain-containing protein [Pedobacter panaciterrae]
MKKQSENMPKLHAEQLVIHALQTLLDLNRTSLPVYEDNKCIGVIYLCDLVNFLTMDDPTGELLFHKLNFDLESAMNLMSKI